MKDVLLILSLCLCVILAWAGSTGSGSKSTNCPTLEQLIEEKTAKEKQERREAAAIRREIIREKLHSLFPEP